MGASAGQGGGGKGGQSMQKPMALGGGSQPTYDRYQLGSNVASGAMQMPATNASTGQPQMPGGANDMAMQWANQRGAMGMAIPPGNPAASFSTGNPMNYAGGAGGGGYSLTGQPPGGGKGNPQPGPSMPMPGGKGMSMNGPMGNMGGGRLTTFTPQLGQIKQGGAQLPEFAQFPMQGGPWGGWQTNPNQFATQNWMGGSQGYAPPPSNPMPAPRPQTGGVDPNPAAAAPAPAAPAAAPPNVFAAAASAQPAGQLGGWEQMLRSDPAAAYYALNSEAAWFNNNKPAIEEAIKRAGYADMGTYRNQFGPAASNAPGGPSDDQWNKIRAWMGR